MATQYDNAIQQLYVAYFNRPADASGIAHWANFMSNGGTAAQISAAFAQSLEYQTTYSQSTYAGIVTQVYTNLFGRSPDATGLAFWVKALQNKDMTVDNMVTTIAAGAQTTDKVAFDSKVKVAVAFTNALDTPAEMAGYAGAKANDAAKALLSTIKTDENANAAITPAALNKHVSDVIKAGVDFTLANGLAALGNADKAIVEFLAGAKVTDAAGKAIAKPTETDVTAQLGRADTAVNGKVVGLTGETNEGVRAALIAKQVEVNADKLEASNAALTKSQEAVAKIDGLADAVAVSTSAAEASEAAAKSEVQADAALKSAIVSIETLNAAANLSVDATTWVVTGNNSATPPVQVPLTTVNATTGIVSVATGVTAANYPGLAEFVAAANAYAGAVDNAAEAKEAALLAQLEVELLDHDTDGTTVNADSIIFSTVTPEVAGKPTIDEVIDQLSALRSTGTDTQVNKFLGEISAFVAANKTTTADDVVAKEKVVKADQKAIDDLAKALATQATAKALADELKALQADRTEAIDAFADNDYRVPTDVNGNKFGTTGSDIFVAGKVDATITSFGRSGDDVLFVGSDYVLNKGALTTGNNSALEVFFTQQGNNTLVTIEKVAFGSSASAGADAKIVITLTGVDAADLTFDNGIISL